MGDVLEWFGPAGHFGWRPPPFSGSRGSDSPWTDVLWVRVLAEATNMRELTFIERANIFVEIIANGKIIK